ncbi:DUF6597 domain-containing transcriptional factor, partial [Actinomadura adrarensis]
MADMGRGVLYPHRQAPIVELDRVPAGAELARFVEFYWHVRWHTPEPYETKVLSHPNVHLVFEEPHPLVYGVDRDLFVRRLEGRGQVLGVKFRPGCFRPFIGRPASVLTDRRVPAASLFGPEVEDVNRAVLEAADTAKMADLAEDFLGRIVPEPDPVAEEVAAMVGRITADAGLFRVDQA